MAKSESKAQRIDLGAVQARYDASLKAMRKKYRLLQTALEAHSSAKIEHEEAREELQSSARVVLGG